MRSTPYKKEKFGQRKTYTEERRFEDTGRHQPCDWSNISTRQGMPLIIGKPQKVEEPVKCSTNTLISNLQNNKTLLY
jgi:hypothetical protein